jgi:GTPase SAR1 family protein
MADKESMELGTFGSFAVGKTCIVVQFVKVCDTKFYHDTISYTNIERFRGRPRPNNGGK